MLASYLPLLTSFESQSVLWNIRLNGCVKLAEEICGFSRFFDHFMAVRRLAGIDTSSADHDTSIKDFRVDALNFQFFVFVRNFFLA